MSETPVKIISKEGLLFVSPPMFDLQEDELYFWLGRDEMVERTFFDRKLSQNVTRQVRTGKTIRTREPLFSLTDDKEWLMTHDGLLSRILDYLEKNRRPFTYERYGTPLPEFEWGPWVAAGQRPEQTQAMISLLAADKRIGAPLSGGLVEMTMATGKTHLIAGLCRAFRKKRGVITTYKQAVVRRLFEGLNEILNPIGIEVGMVQGNIREFKQITVCTDALLDEFDPEEVDFILYDEAHRAGGNAISAKLLEFGRALKFGFSGTLKKRADGKQKYLEAIFGPIVFEYGDQQAEQDRRVTPQRVYALSVPQGPRVHDKSDLIKERRGITENKFRNQAIRDVVDLVPEGQQVIVFVRTIKHIEHLMEMYLPKDFVVYHGELSDSERKRLEEGITSGTIRKIVANDALGEGVDTTHLDVVIDAAWTQSDVNVSQKGGRNRRLRQGKPYGVIVAFRDNWGEDARLRNIDEKASIGMEPTDEEQKIDPLFRRAKARLKQYEDRGWPIFEIDSPKQIEFVQSVAESQQDGSEEV